MRIGKITWRKAQAPRGVRHVLDRLFPPVYAQPWSKFGQEGIETVLPKTGDPVLEKRAMDKAAALLAVDGTDVIYSDQEGPYPWGFDIVRESVAGSYLAGALLPLAAKQAGVPMQRPKVAVVSGRIEETKTLLWSLGHLERGLTFFTEDPGAWAQCLTQYGQWTKTEVTLLSLLRPERLRETDVCFYLEDWPRKGRFLKKTVLIDASPLLLLKKSQAERQETMLWPVQAFVAGNWCSLSEAALSFYLAEKGGRSRRALAEQGRDMPVRFTPK